MIGSKKFIPPALQIRDKKFLVVITLIMGKASIFNSSRWLMVVVGEGLQQKFIFSLQGLGCLQLKIIHISQRLILG